MRPTQMTYNRARRSLYACNRDRFYRLRTNRQYGNHRRQ